MHYTMRQSCYLQSLLVSRLKNPHGAILVQFCSYVYYQCHPPQGGTIMATIVRRPGKNGQLNYRAQLRRKGTAPLSAPSQSYLMQKSGSKSLRLRSWKDDTSRLLAPSYSPATQTRLRPVRLACKSTSSARLISASRVPPGRCVATPTLIVSVPRGKHASPANAWRSTASRNRSPVRCAPPRSVSGRMSANSSPP